MKTPGEKSRGEDDPGDMHRELMIALEKARTRLAVAMASEGKMALLRHWKRYVEMDRRMRRSLQILRMVEPRQCPQRKDWAAALETLRKLPAGDPAAPQGITGQICNRLCEALTSLEQAEDSDMHSIVKFRGRE